VAIPEQPNLSFEQETETKAGWLMGKPASNPENKFTLPLDNGEPLSQTPEQSANPTETQKKSEESEFPTWGSGGSPPPWGK